MHTEKYEWLIAQYLSSVMMRSNHINSSCNTKAHVEFDYNLLAQILNCLFCALQLGKYSLPIHELYQQIYADKHICPMHEIKDYETKEHEAKRYADKEHEIKVNSTKWHAKEHENKDCGLQYQVLYSNIINCPILTVKDDNQHVYIRRFYDYESYIYQTIKELINQQRKQTRANDIINTHPSVDHILWQDKLCINHLKIKLIGELIGLRLDDDQVNAVYCALHNRFNIITGLPGCGKTTIIFLFVYIANLYFSNIQLTICAPTGKAITRIKESFIDKMTDIDNINCTQILDILYCNESQQSLDYDSLKQSIEYREQKQILDHDSHLKQSLEHNLTTCRIKFIQQRLEEVHTLFSNTIKYNITTIHKLLGYIPDSIHFKYNQTKQLPFNIVIIDESSMVGLNLFYKLFLALNTQEIHSIILLGDQDQLPSIELGKIFNELCRSVVCKNNIVHLSRSYRFQNASLVNLVNNLSRYNISKQIDHVSIYQKIYQQIANNEIAAVKFIALQDLGLDKLQYINRDEMTKIITHFMYNHYNDHHLVDHTCLLMWQNSLLSIFQEYFFNYFETCQQIKAALEQKIADAVQLQLIEYEKAGYIGVEPEINLEQDLKIEQGVKINYKIRPNCNIKAEQEIQEIKIAGEMSLTDQSRYDAFIVDMIYTTIINMLSSHNYLKLLFSKINQFRILCSHNKTSYGTTKINQVIDTIWQQYIKLYNVNNMKQSHASEDNTSINHDILNDYQQNTNSISNYFGKLIMIDQNNYKDDLYNGDIGIVIHCDIASIVKQSNLGNNAIKDSCGSIDYVLFEDNRLIEIKKIKSYTSAFAISIHKSQGSEFDHAIIVLNQEFMYNDTRQTNVAHNNRLDQAIDIDLQDANNYDSIECGILTKEMIYTAITRARHGCVIYANQEIMLRIGDNDRYV